MTRVIAFLSGKGGVGKTFLVANLGVALVEMGKSVTVVDGNLTTPNLALHLGMSFFPKTIHDVLKGKATLLEAIYEHDTGLRVIPAGISINDLRNVDARDFAPALLELVGKEEIVLIDAAAGLGREALAAIEASDEAVFVTNPELPAVLDALKASKMAEQLGVKVTGCVLNRVTRKSFELSAREIGELIDMEILGEIPEDETVKKAIALRVPVVVYDPRARASVAIKQIAARLIGARYEERIPWYKRIFPFLR